MEGLLQTLDIHWMADKAAVRTPCFFVKEPASPNRTLIIHMVSSLASFDSEAFATDLRGNGTDGF